MSERKEPIPYLLKGQNWRGDVVDMRASAKRLWKRLKAKWLRRRAARDDVVRAAVAEVDPDEAGTRLERAVAALARLEKQ